MTRKTKQEDKKLQKVKNNILLEKLIENSHSNNREMLTVLVTYLSELEHEINILKNK